MTAEVQEVLVKIVFCWFAQSVFADSAKKPKNRCVGFP